MQKPHRRELLDQLVSAKALTPDGRDWLTLALDPFHDYNHTLAGYPDADVSQTVVACYEYQYQLAAPNGVVGNWDAHIFTTPLMTTEALLIGNIEAGWNKVTQNAGASNVVMGPLTVYASAAGGRLYPATDVFPTTQIGLPQGANASDFSKGISRIIGMGFEVTNTTAEISKQGSVTCYRMPQNPGDTNTVFSNNAGTFIAPYSGKQYAAPPASVQEALLLKGTVTWNAADGCYVVASQSSVSNPLCNAATPGFLITNAQSGLASTAMMGAFSTLGTNAAPIPSVVTPLIRKFSPFDVSGAFFSGLSNGTTLQITLKAYVERAPTQSTSDLAVLATPSAPYDMLALELYSHLVGRLPVAVHVDENAMGDWWRKIMSLVSNVAVPIGAALTPFNPLAPAIGAIIKQGADLATDAFAKKPKADKKSNVAVKKQVQRPQPKSRPNT